MDNYNSQNSFKTYKLSPHWLQYVINQLPWLIICLCGFLFAGDDTLPYRSYILIASMGLLAYLLYLAIDMKRIEYVITGEQLISMGFCSIRLTSWNYTESWTIRNTGHLCSRLSG